MKSLLYLLVFLFSAVTFGQVDFNSLIRNAKKMELPYTTGDSYKIEKEMILLDEIPMKYILDKLRSIHPKIVSQYGSSFGTLDPEENFLDSDRVENIFIICYIKTKDGYLLHLNLNRPSGMSRGLLMSISSNGEFIDWLVCNGALTGGNPHGDAYRQMDIDVNETMTFIESSWGDNIESYAMSCEYIIAKESNMDGMKKGGFTLRRMCINFQNN